MSVAFSELGLTKEQARLMFSYQYQLIMDDISHSSTKESEKADWSKQWIQSVDAYLSELKGTGPSRILTDGGKLHSEAERIGNSLMLNNRTPLYLILLELTLFHPYYPLSEKEKNGKLGYKRNNELLRSFARQLSVGEDYVDKYLHSYATAVRGITGYWPKVIGAALAGAILLAITAGFAAPMIGALFAAEGLAGAAATSAGLAALGGGAIAAGGAGMAGGIAVIVGGGALLGLGSGVGVGKLLATSPQFALSGAAKLEVVMREITLTAQKDIRVAQEIIKEQHQTVQALDDRLFELQKDRDKNKDEIKTLKKSIEYLRSAIERNRSYLEDHRAS